MDTNHLGLGFSIPPTSWLDMRLSYVRLSCCSVEDAPESLTIRYLPRTYGSNFEVNGARVSPTEEAVLILRRDRMDTDSAEATFVSTDRLRTTGSLPFDVCDKGETLLCGIVDMRSDDQAFDRLGAVGAFKKKSKPGWFLECKCAVRSSGCAFLKRKGDVNVNGCSPFLEVYIAGHYNGSPVVLTQTVQLIARRKTSCRGTLGAIPEAVEAERTDHNLAVDDIANQMEELTFYQEMDNKPGMLGFNDLGGYMEGDDGEITWFNTGVRVGVGIGLGMCVGIGIGVGLLMKTYQATTRSLRRRFL